VALRHRAARVALDDRHTLIFISVLVFITIAHTTVSVSIPQQSERGEIVPQIARGPRIDRAAHARKGLRERSGRGAGDCGRVGDGQRYAHRGGRHDGCS
jgi:hypothetical protein